MKLFSELALLGLPFEESESVDQFPQNSPWKQQESDF